MKEFQVTLTEMEGWLIDGEPRWECEDSPSGYCRYNFEDDPPGDSCVYCGQPLERK